MSDRQRPSVRLLAALFAAVVGVIVAIGGAALLLESARVVEVATMFAGAFGAGAAFVHAVHAYRAGKGEDASGSGE